MKRKFIEKVVEVMEKEDVAIYKLCKDNGISQTTFQNWKNGSEPSIVKAVRIAKYLGLSLDELFEIKTEKAEDKKELFTEGELNSLQLLLEDMDYYLIGHLVGRYGEEKVKEVISDVLKIRRKLYQREDGKSYGKE